MSHQADLTFLDRPEILETVFPLVYSPFYMAGYPRPLPSGIPVYPIEVEPGININCGLWVKAKELPTVLYFHGNGETVDDYTQVAPLFHQRGINLFVVDYRGYGSSDGKPTISNMVSDAHTLFKGALEIIKNDGFTYVSPFIMGRSLGSIPAVEIACHYQDKICGIIIESGTANNFRSLWNSSGLSGRENILGEEGWFLNKVKVRQVNRPTLIIHGEYDDIIPVTEGQELYLNSGAQEREFLIIPGAGHNDIMMADHNLYFSAIERFVNTHNIED